jgi:hypothetical protein
MDDQEQRLPGQTDRPDAELIDLAVALSEGVIDEAGAARLNELLSADGRNREVYMRLMHAIAGLEWEGPGLLMTVLPQSDDPSIAARLSSIEKTASTDSEHIYRNTAPSASSQTSRSTESTHVRPLRRSNPWNRGLLSQRTALLVATLAGVAAGSLLTRQFSNHAVTPQPPSASALPQAGQQRAGADPYVATLINVTNCRWDKVRSSADLRLGSLLRPGESLHLLEGVAQIETQGAGGATIVQLEGPAAMTLTSQGMPSLLYGKLTASFASKFDQFALDTPLGRVTVSGDASIGVTSAPNQVELHVFTGSATLELWTMKADAAAEQLTATSGTSLGATVAESGRISISHGAARESWFITPAAVAESRLPISDQYVKLIHSAKPLAYWRFEECDGAVMRNDMGDRLACRMMGDAVRWRPGQNGGAVEFGATAGPGYLISDDTLDGLLADSYTVELWAKPSYYHHGALFSLIQWTPSQSPLGTHRMHLELCGPVSGFPVPFRPNESNPGRIRFIQQCKVKFDVECYSSAPYTVRKWQHIAAVKEGSTMRLYVNGEAVDSKDAQGKMDTGLRVLMGQLFPISPKLEDEVTSRLYGGELDEVALYDHALTPTELKERVQLAFPDHRAKAEVNDESL